MNRFSGGCFSDWCDLTGGQPQSLRPATPQSETSHLRVGAAPTTTPSRHQRAADNLEARAAGSGWA